MITVGLIKELQFISEALKTPVKVCLGCGEIKSTLNIEIKNDIFEAWYLGYRIWNENIKDDISMFGVESCDAIAKIIFGIDIGSESWRELVYLENKN